MMEDFGSEINLVFVHLGQATANHIEPNLKLISANYPNYRTHLIVSENTNIFLDSKSDVSIFIYKPKLEIEHLLKRNFQDTSFRNGFWRYSFERFFALSSFHQANPLTKIIHLESDIFLFPNCPLDKFLELPTMSWLNVDEKKDVASIIYMPSLEQTAEFERRLISHLEKELKTTDMLALRSLRNSFPEDYNLLPSMSPGFPELQNMMLENDHESRHLDQMCRYNILFGGVFDPAPYGMWLTGIDPRNNYGKTNLFDTSTILNAKFYIDPSKYQFNYNGLEGLTLTTNSQKLRIWNLHIHSKSLKIFNDSWESEIQRLVELSQRETVIQEFDIRIFLSLIRSNFLEGSLLPYVYYSPVGVIVRKVHNFVRRLAKGSK